MPLVRRDLELTFRAVGWQAAGLNLRCPVTIVHKDLFSILIAACGGLGGATGKRHVLLRSSQLKRNSASADPNWENFILQDRSALQPSGPSVFL